MLQKAVIGQVGAVFGHVWSCGEGEVVRAGGTIGPVLMWAPSSPRTVGTFAVRIQAGVPPLRGEVPGTAIARAVCGSGERQPLEAGAGV